MNRYLISFLSVFFVMDVYAVVPVAFGEKDIAMVYNYDHIDFSEIKETDADLYSMKNSAIFINNLSDWQEWDADVEILSNVSLFIKNLNMSNNGERLQHVSSTDSINISVKDPDNLYRVDFTAEYGDLFLHLVRETDYEKVFADVQGSFIENLRLNKPDDKMLLAMDGAKTMEDVNFIMNSSYHFNPMILMNPVKIINRAVLLDFLNETKTDAGADVSFIMSNKMNSYSGLAYVANKYKNFYLKFGLNINRFSYADDFNEFDGFAYGVDIRAKQFINNFWLDGLLGIKRAYFDADYVYNDGNVSENPKGLSEFARLSVGYDIKHVSDFVLSPFAGLMFQKSDIMWVSDTDVNLHTGIIGKYNFITDGIKYVYGASVATDENACWDVGANVGFLSVVDNAGANFEINTFKDEFGINYKFLINAKVQF